MLAFLPDIEIKVGAAKSLWRYPKGGYHKNCGVWHFGKLPDAALAELPSDSEKNVDMSAVQLLLHAPQALPCVQQCREQNPRGKSCQRGQNDEQNGYCQQNQRAGLQSGQNPAD